MWESEKIRVIDVGSRNWMSGKIWPVCFVYFSAWHQQHPLKLRCCLIVILIDTHALSFSSQVCPSYDPHRTFTATELTEAMKTQEFGAYYFNYMYSFLVCACLTVFAYVHGCFIPCVLVFASVFVFVNVIASLFMLVDFI